MKHFEYCFPTKKTYTTIGTVSKKKKIKYLKKKSLKVKIIIHCNFSKSTQQWVQLPNNIKI